MAIQTPPPSTFLTTHETAPARGTYMCVLCEFPLSAEREDVLPECPNCGETQYRPASIFAPSETLRDDLAETPGARQAPEWLDEARTAAERGGRPCLAHRGDEMVHVFTLGRPLSRIGRSLAADVLLDDPTVSRRHAMIANENGLLTLHDDRSLNGTFVNGERIEQAELTDGDEIVVGCAHLFVLIPEA